MDAAKIVQSSQEQAAGAWVDYLNQIRLDRLVAALARQDVNLASAMETIDKAFANIREDIMLRNRGGGKGMHGFIAEIAECGIGNARQQIIGEASIYEWVNDNGPIDLMRGTEAIQQKFVQSGGHLSLSAILQHLFKYPDYISGGGKYQIPKDHYDKIMEYLSMPESVANKLPTSNGEFSLRQWKEVHAVLFSGEVSISDLEPSILEYGDVQQGTIGTTIDQEKEHISSIDKERRDAAYQESTPTFSEGIKVTAFSAAIEGVTSFCSAVIRKRKAGKKISKLNESDWHEIAGDSGKGTLKGGIRGASIYLLTNYTATPGAVASAIVTASFGMAEQAHQCRQGKISETQFIENSEMLCLDASVSALSSFAGQVIIPIPILGAVIGNAVGTLMYQLAKDGLSNKERAIVEQYLQEIAILNEKLNAEYSQYIEQLNHNYSLFLELINNAFSPDVEVALMGSVELAKSLGVPTDEILDTPEKIAAYFMD